MKTEVVISEADGQEPKFQDRLPREMLGFFRYTIPGRLRRHSDLLTALSHQAVLSSANFGGQMVYARYLAPAEFGRLRLLLSIFYVAIGAMNAIVLEPFILNHAVPDFERAGHDYLNKLSILCLALAAATGLAAFLVAVIVPRSGVLLISVLVTALYSFVHFTLWLLRWYFSAKSALIRILWFDAVYLILTAAACATTVVLRLRSAEWAMAALGIGGLPVVIAALATTRDAGIVRLQWPRVLAAHYATARYYLVIAVCRRRHGTNADLVERRPAGAECDRRGGHTEQQSGPWRAGDQWARQAVFATHEQRMCAESPRRGRCCDEKEFDRLRGYRIDLRLPGLVPG